MSYRQEKLMLAVQSLIGANPIKDRLFSAFVDNLVRLTQDDFPEDDLRRRFETLRQALNEKPALADEGTAQATINQMSNQEAEYYAVEILSLLLDVYEREGINTP